MIMPSPPQAPEFLSWQDVDRLIDYLLPQLRGPYDALLMITRGGIIPGGLIAEALDIRQILTAAIEFPHAGQGRFVWPTFLQFPDETLVRDRRVLIVDDIWAHGRTMTTVKGRILVAGGRPETAVLHYKPGTSLFRESGPDYYAAVTDRFIVYPWEAQRGPDRSDRRVPQPN
ncbi:MAG: phosphoribosyltransferase family protein [Anaerolineae bacterium]|nr:phosphoribosyltransferase family protein [Anaerolineae bacterium]